jgi:uncharacterized membrane protein YkvA (DUF1232 family)
MPRRSSGRSAVSARLWRTGAQRLKVYLAALWTLWRDPRTPRVARWLAVAVLAYAVSPIDLIPDFIPVLGQLDDLILVPLGIAMVVKLTPRVVWDEALRDAESQPLNLPRWRVGVVIVGLVWLLAAALLIGAAVWLLGG